MLVVILHLYVIIHLCIADIYININTWINREKKKGIIEKKKKKKKVNELHIRVVSLLGLVCTRPSLRMANAWETKKRRTCFSQKSCQELKRIYAFKILCLTKHETYFVPFWSGKPTDKRGKRKAASSSAPTTKPHSYY